MAEYIICESPVPMWFEDDMERAANDVDQATMTAEFRQAAVDLAKAFMKIDDNDFINSYEASDEAACAHLKGIAREAAGTIRRLSQQASTSQETK